ncbi:O-antigen ligase family protein [Pelagibacteraceae bacterium]|nr:O-antigen ligase family protein [Pelagibacteraceae bacterium]
METNLNKKNFIFILNYLFILFPISLILGPFFTNLTVTLIAFFAIYYIFRNKKIWILIKNFVSLILLIFLVYCFLNSLFSIYLIDSFYTFISYSRYFFFSIGVAIILLNNEKNLIYFGYILLSVLFILSIDSYFQFFLGKNVFGWEMVEPGRVSSLFREELIMGSFITRLLPLIIFYLILFSSKNKYFVFLSILLFPIILSLVFFSGERTALIMMIMQLILFLFLLNINIKFLALTLISLLTINIIAFQNTNLKERLFDKTYEEIIYNLNYREYDSTLSNEVLEIRNIKRPISKTQPERSSLLQTGYKYNNIVKLPIPEYYQSIYQVAFNIFLDKPILGSGIKSFRQLCKKEKFYILGGCASHPHSTYFQLLAELGLIGLIIISILFLLISFKLLKNFFYKLLYKKNTNNLENLMLITAFCTLWPFIPSGNFFGSYINAFFYLPLGFYFYNKYKDIW